jgi:Domain of unknown function (DUF5666)/Domain of unknown function (DUF4382)
MFLSFPPGQHICGGPAVEESMKRAILFSSLFIVALGITLAACGGGSNNSGGVPGPAGQMVPTSFSISDTPPAGVVILRFQIQVTAASLQPSPSNASQQPVSLLTAPATVELEHLQSESALLSNLSVPAGTYTSLNATFANPQMTIFNRSNMTFTVGGQSCMPQQLCTLTPTLNQSMISDESAPFPITLSSTSPVNLLLHFDVNASVQGDLSVSPTISLKELPPLPSGAIAQFHVVGRITAVDTNSFTLQTGFGNHTFMITTNPSTQYQFGSVCAADTFACLMVGEVVRVGLEGMPGGTFVATEVELIAPQGMPVLEGVVIGVNTAMNQVQLALMDFQDDAQRDLVNSKFLFGLQLIVQFSNSTMFNVDTDGITLPASTCPGPSCLSFASIQDMIVGQALAVQPILSSIQIDPVPPKIQITFTARNVYLQSSELTATVESVNSPSFTLDMLPPLFTGATPPITQIDVDTVAGTNFENITGVGALADGDTVSVGGLLFNTQTTPTLIAERVLQR